ncbi:MAG: porin [Gammaproteobacteria bacterium]|nr:porin [Gammaproteobacteria bacterium]
MKRKLIAVAVSAALLPMGAMADIDIYGKVHLSADSLDNDTTSSTYLSSNSSRLGVKGSTDFENGLTGMFQLEGGISMSDDGSADTRWGTTRDSYLGLKGGFGTLLAGRLPAANQYVYDANLFADQVGDAGTFTGTAMPGRVNDALHYVLPAFGSATIALTHKFEQGTEDGSANGARVTFNAAGVDLGLTYFTLGDALAAGGTPESVIAVSAGYDFGMGSVKAMGVQNTNEGGVDDGDRTIMTLGAAFNAGSGTAKIQYTTADEGVKNSDDGASMIGVGYDHPLYKNTTVYVSYATVDNDDGGTYHPFNWGHGASPGAPAAGDKASGISIGMVYDF